MTTHNNHPKSNLLVKLICHVLIKQLDGYNFMCNYKVDNTKVAPLKSWSKTNTIQDALMGIRKEMESSTFKKLQQPQEGTTF